MAAPDDAALEEFLDLAFDFACTRRVSELVDVAGVVAALDAGCTAPRVAWWQARVFVPMRARVLERARASTVLVGQWLPEDATATLGEMLGAPMPIPRPWIDEFVASERLRDAVRAMLQEALTTFIARATAPSTGERGGLRDALGWGARALGAAGRGLLGSLGEEVQRQLQDRARDFVDGQVTQLQTRIAEKLASDDTARALGKRRLAAFRTLLGQTEGAATKAWRKAPHEALDPLVPRVVEHNARRAELRAVVVAELGAVLEDLSRDTLGELLDHTGQRAAIHAALHARGLPLARAFVATPGFASWWARVTEP